MKNNHYRGWRSRHGSKVKVNGKSLPKRLGLRNHSPGAFDWGYSGSAPAQLALAILAFEFDDATAAKYHQQFKREVVCGLGNEWSLGSYPIQEWLLKAQAQSAALPPRANAEGGAS